MPNNSGSSINNRKSFTLYVWNLDFAHVPFMADVYLAQLTKACDNLESFLKRHAGPSVRRLVLRARGVQRRIHDVSVSSLVCLSTRKIECTHTLSAVAVYVPVAASPARRGPTRVATAIVPPRCPEDNRVHTLDFRRSLARLASFSRPRSAFSALLRRMPTAPGKTGRHLSPVCPVSRDSTARSSSWAFFLLARHLRLLSR